MNKEAVKMYIADECERQGITDINQIAYILATVDHETNSTFLPVVEAYWLSDRWRKKHLEYYPYYGRGLVQITWKKNYEKFGKLLNINMIDDPDLALDIENAVFILVYGMKHGTFTGKKLSDFINSSVVDFFHARKIINGMDKANHIAMIAAEEEIIC